MLIKIQKVHPKAIVPDYATSGAACFDLHSVEAGEFGMMESAKSFDIGLKFEIPEGYAMFIYSRSGDGFKKDVRLANCVGIIDSDYRGEVKVKLTADRMQRNFVNVGDRIAQAMLMPVQQVRFGLVHEVSTTERGEGGFGSTGK